VLYSGSPADRPGDVSLWLADLKSGLTTQVEVPDVGPSPEGMLSGRLRGDTLVLQHRSMAFTGVRTFVVRRSGTKTHRIDSFAEIPVLPDPRVEFWRAGERRIPSALVLPSWYREGQSAPLPVLMAPYGGPHAQRLLHAHGAFVGAQRFAGHRGGLGTGRAPRSGRPCPGGPGHRPGGRGTPLRLPGHLTRGCSGVVVRRLPGHPGGAASSRRVPRRRRRCPSHRLEAVRHPLHRALPGDPPHATGGLQS